MSCCGEPKIADEQARNRPVAQSSGYINQQPGPQVGLSEKQGFRQPSISSPSPVHNNPYGQNGQQQLWGSQSPSPPPGTPWNSQYTNVQPQNDRTSPIMRPNSTHQPSSSISAMRMSPGPGPLSPTPLGPRREFAQPVDEGKMSVSIDFGELDLVLSSRHHRC